MSRTVRFLAVGLFVMAFFFLAPTQPTASALDRYDRDGYWNNHWNWYHNHYAPYYHRSYYGVPAYGNGYYGNGFYGNNYGTYGPGYGPYNNGVYGGYVAPGVGVQVGGVGIGTWW